MQPLVLVRHQGKGPHRPAGRDGVRRFHGPVENAAYARQHSHELPTLVRVGNGRRIDAGTGLELPPRLAGGLIECDELAVNGGAAQLRRVEPLRRSGRQMPYTCQVGDCVRSVWRLSRRRMGKGWKGHFRMNFSGHWVR
jgi:hypothetical protein